MKRATDSKILTRTVAADAGAGVGAMGTTLWRSTAAESVPVVLSVPTAGLAERRAALNPGVPQNISLIC